MRFATVSTLSLGRGLWRLLAMGLYRGENMGKSPGLLSVFRGDLCGGDRGCQSVSLHLPGHMEAEGPRCDGGGSTPGAGGGSV